MVNIIYNQDGAIDEYMAGVVLDNMEGVTLQAIVLTNGDCLGQQAMEAAWKIAQFTERSEMPLSLSESRIYQAFPYSYRSDCIRQRDIPCLQPYAPAPQPPYAPGNQALAALLRQAIEDDAPLTLVCTCSLTTIYDVLSAEPELEAGVDHLLWMGGALNVKGNLDPTTIPPEIANTTAEWNVFSDPEAADWVLNHPGRGYQVTVCPLDLTDQAKITEDFKQALAAQSDEYRLSLLGSQSYALVGDEPFYELWNVSSVCYLVHPEFYQPPQTMQLSIVPYGFDQGTMRPTDDPASLPVDVVLAFAEIDAFYDYVLQVFRSY
ncbi:MAG: hypothetical protein QOH86_1598 [Sphingomonadales bacterium]|nr:hypothetical protein [Sphingomonadales bacterium]